MMAAVRALRPKRERPSYADATGATAAIKTITHKKDKNSLFMSSPHN